MKETMKFSKLKRITSILLLLCLIITSFNTIGVSADSNDLRRTYIEMMSGRDVTSIDGATALTTDDLRCVALYLSNFYVPFNTSLDVNTEDSNKESMINSLVTIGMNKNVAESLINATYSASLSSATELYVKIDDLKNFYDDKHKRIGFGFGKDDDIDPGILFATKDDNKTLYTEGYVSAVGQVVTYGGEDYTPLTVFLWDAIVNHLAGNMDDVISLGYFDFYRYDGAITKCFTLNDVTLAFLTQYLKDSSQGSNGEAINSLINLSNYNDWDSLNDNEKAKISAAAEKIYVDWVGNILYDAGDKRVVIYPACINPCTFTKISSNNVKNYNLVSSWGMYLANTNSASFSDSKLTIKAMSKDLEWKLSRGSSTKAKWSTKETDDGTNAGQNIKTFWKDTLGFSVGVDANIGSQILWFNSGDTVIRYSSGNIDVTDDNSTTKVLVYADISNEKIKSIGNNSESVFKTASICSDALHSSAFTTTSKFATSSADINSYMAFGSAEKQMLSNFFLTYAFAYANKDSTTFDEKKNYIDMKFNAENFPEADSTEIEWGSVSTTGDQVLSFVYYLLHPVEGVNYVATLIKTKVTGLFIKWHEDIVGGTDSNSTTGMTRYLGFSGYVTSPNLNDISWLSSLVKYYNNIIVFLIIFMCIILVVYVITGIMDIQRGVTGVVIFSTLAFMPPLAINATINSVNKICDSIFSSKFDYWATCQMQSYLGQLNSLQNVSNAEDYIAKLMKIETGGAGSKNFYTGTKLKWMSPKKFNELNKASEEISNSLAGQTFSTNFTNLMISSIANNSTSTEDYSRSVGQTYLYRDICDIYRYSSIGYNVYTSFNWNTLTSNEEYRIADTKDSDKNNFIGSAGKFADTFGNMTYSDDESIFDYLAVNDDKAFNITSTATAIKDTSSINAINRGFLYDTIALGNSGVASVNYYNKNQLATTYLLTYRDTIADIHRNYTKYCDMLKNDDLSITASAIKSGACLYGIEPSTFTTSLNDITEQSVLPSRSQLSGFYYALYAESPYYYFNWNIRDQLNASGLYNYNYDNLEAGHDFYKLFTQDNQSYFFNLISDAGDGYGELRDFMNFHDFFYYVMPVLQEGNYLADAFDARFTLKPTGSCSLRLSSDGKWHYDNIEFNSLSDFVGLKDTQDRDKDGDTSELLWNTYTDEERYNLWHDYNVWTIFNNYVTWLDTMQDCSYAKSETIRVAGDKYTVSNPLDPSSYFKVDANGNMTSGRYMVFSESEMKYYGLSESDLTTVERKIIAVQKSVYNTSIDLMNYYTLSDETLLNAFSLIELFEFNKEFSQSSIIGSDYVLYPQGYELKAFTYDAYLRLIVSEASGESIMDKDNKSIYQRVAENTSIFFGIFLILNDLFAVYIVPMLKVFIIMLLFIISILMLIGATIKLEFNFLKLFWRSIAFPLLTYSAIGIGMAFVVSLFMSNGADGVTKTSITINLGDPTMALILMLVINAGVVILYYKLVKRCFNDFKTYIKAVVDNIGSTLVDAFGGLVTGTVSNKAKNKFGGSSSSRSIASTAKQRGIDNNPKKGKTSYQNSKLSNNNNSLMYMSKSDIKKQRKRNENAKSMNKYDRKIYNKANAKADEQKTKYDAAQRKLRIAKNNGASAKKVARLQKAVDKERNKYNSRLSYSNSINMYGVRGANKNVVKKLISDNPNRLGRLVAGTKNKVDTVKDTGKAISRGTKKTAKAMKHPVQTTKNVAKSSSSVLTKKVDNIGKTVESSYKKGYDSVRK